MCSSLWSTDELASVFIFHIHSSLSFVLVSFVFSCLIFYFGHRTLICSVFLVLFRSCRIRVEGVKTLSRAPDSVIILCGSALAGTRQQFFDSLFI